MLKNSDFHGRRGPVDQVLPEAPGNLLIPPAAKCAGRLA
jgi:hypothetical protein